MELHREILQLQKIPQPQIIVFNNITKIISRSYIERTVVNPPDDFLYLHIFALVVVLILGFVLGIGVMFLYLRWDKWLSKSEEEAENLKRSISQQCKAESDSSCGNLTKSDCPSLDSRSTSAKSSPSLPSETDETGMVPMFLENGQCSTRPDPLQHNAYISELSDNSEMKAACIQRDVSRRDFSGNNDVSESAPADHQQLLQLRLKQEYTQSSRPAEIPQPEETEQIKLQLSSQEIDSMKRESDIHQKDSKLVEKIVNVTEYCGSKTDELKQPIPYIFQSNPKECPSLVCLENRGVLPKLENGEQLRAERKPSSDFKDLKSITPTPKDDAVAMNPQRQTSPAKEVNEDRLIGCDAAIRLQRTPSPLCSSKPVPANQGFSHLTGFFDTVFGDKSLIGKGGFGEVFKAIHKLEQKLYAVKKVKLLVKEGEDIRQNKLFREVFAMISLHHPHIVRHHTTWTEEPHVAMKLEHNAKKPCNDRKLLAFNRQKSQESLLMTEEHTKISDLGFEWDVSNQEKSQNDKDQDHQAEQSSEAESFSRSQSMIKTVSQVQTSVLEEDLKSNESVSVINKSLLQKFPDHQLVYLFLQMEYCSGASLMDHLDGSRNSNNISDIFKIFKQILEGVNAIHETGIIHRDLKPSNIFFEKGFVKIGDFGLSWLGDQQEDNPESAPDLTSKEEIKAGKANGYTSNIGTPFYVSPEQEKSTVYDNKTDIYSLGIILFELISYFKTRHERGESIKALRKEGKIDPQLAQRFPEFSKLVLQMTDKNPEKRPSAREALAMLVNIGSTN